MPVDRASLKPFAERYIWWMTPDEAVKMPDRVVAQVMNIGDWDDTQALLRLVGEDYFREVLQHAEIGQFNARSWHYWHYRLGVAAHGQVPPMPTRRLG